MLSFNWIAKLVARFTGRRSDPIPVGAIDRTYHEILQEIDQEPRLPTPEDHRRRAARLEVAFVRWCDATWTELEPEFEAALTSGDFEVAGRILMRCDNPDCWKANRDRLRNARLSHRVTD